MSKICVIYYSRNGENYYSGIIKNSIEGNTQKVVNMIKEEIECDSFHVKEMKEYSSNYHTCTEEAMADLKGDKDIPLASDIDVTPYDTIILGYPIYWGTIPQALRCFLKHHDLSNKKLYAFSTHEGSGLGHSINDINKLCPNSKIIKTLALNGTDIISHPNEIKLKVKEWLK